MVKSSPLGSPDFPLDMFCGCSPPTGGAKGAGDGSACLIPSACVVQLEHDSPRVHSRYGELFVLSISGSAVVQCLRRFRGGMQGACLPVVDRRETTHHTRSFCFGLTNDTGFYSRLLALSLILYLFRSILYLRGRRESFVQWDISQQQSRVSFVSQLRVVIIRTYFRACAHRNFVRFMPFFLTPPQEKPTPRRSRKRLAVQEASKLSPGTKSRLLRPRKRKRFGQFHR